MTVHWHDDEVGWCPCDEPEAEQTTDDASSQPVAAVTG